MFCGICAERNLEEGHQESKKHLKNVLLCQLSKDSKHFSENRNGIVISSTVCSMAYNAVPILANSPDHRLKVFIRPRDEVKFTFSIKNDNNREIVFIGVKKFTINRINFNLRNNNMRFGSLAHNIPPKRCFEEPVAITFESATVGVYKMSVYFFFTDNATGEPTIIFKDVEVSVGEVKKLFEKTNSPYMGGDVWARKIIRSPAKIPCYDEYVIPSEQKIAFARDLKTDVKGATDGEKALCLFLNGILDKGPTKENYVQFFHTLIFWDETFVAENLKNYNMSGVKLPIRNLSRRLYALCVPGLAEKRPSLMIGDVAHVRPVGQTNVLFEAVITEIEDNYALFSGLNKKFLSYYSAEARFDVRFIMSRVPFERMHAATEAQPEHGLRKTFPQEKKGRATIRDITRFYNSLVAENPEQRKVVKHIVSKSSGSAPYLLFGPPGTGKTVTIVEAILQLTSNNANHILVCTDSNTAADHVATLLIQYKEAFTSKNFLLRANSEFRSWETMPACLAPYSNGTNRKNFAPVSIARFRSYRIVITTLIHAAKFAGELEEKTYKVQRKTTHLFIDEAAQASEPASMVPVCGLLAPDGQLVLAGDPKQLGPICISLEAKNRGLGVSLMERLITTPVYLKNKNSHYMTMLKRNFRSHTDILTISNELFYDNQIVAVAPLDVISTKNILDNNTKAKSRALVFHGVLSKEERVGKSPSFYNLMELEIVRSYINALVNVHKVAQHDIGVVTPYARQVSKIKEWVRAANLSKIEVGTVEGFQGKEKRVIIISTVRANCDLLAHDAKFRLGFVDDAKRFNVALTRAKAKLIVIGNPLCLRKDDKWRKYMQLCRDFGTYTGFDAGPIEADNDRDEILDQVPMVLQQMTKALATMNL